MKLSTIVSPWDLVLGVACAAVAATRFAPEDLGPVGAVAAVALSAVVFLWYRRRLLRDRADEYAKLQTAAFAVQVLWLTVLYDIAAGLLNLPAAVQGPLNALLLTVGAAALMVSVLVALDLAVVRRPSQVWRLVVGYIAVVAASQGGAAAPPPLGLTGLLVGLVAPMGWLITLERRQRAAVLLGGVLSTVPLLAAAIIFVRSLPLTSGTPLAAVPQAELRVFVAAASPFCLLFVVLLLMRAGQALAGARLYERKVRELDAVYDFGLTTTSALDVQEFQTVVLRSLQRIGAPDVVALVEPGPDDNVQFSLLRNDAEGERIYRHKTRGSWPDLSIRCVDRRPLSIPDHSRSQQPALPRIWEPASGSSVIVPVLTPAGDPRALLIAGKHEAHGFKQAELRSLSGFANQVGLAMEHARLLVELVEGERRKNELEFARQMQMDLLPQKPPSIVGLDIADRSTPATV